MITDEKIAELDEVIAQEKRVAAREVQHDAWTEGILEGIDTDILADAAVAKAIEEIIQAQGESAALALVDTLRDRIIAGEFLRSRTLQ